MAKQRAEDPSHPLIAIGSAAKNESITAYHASSKPLPRNAKPRPAISGMPKAIRHRKVNGPPRLI